MTEHFLDDAQIGAMIKHVCGARVAQNMWRQLRSQTSLGSRTRHNGKGRLSPEPSATIIQKDRLSVSSLQPSNWFKFFSPIAQPKINGFSSTLAYRNQSFFRAFAIQTDKSSIKIEIAHRQTAYF
jgi:hypothetical protein